MKVILDNPNNPPQPSARVQIEFFLVAGPTETAVTWGDPRPRGLEVSMNDFFWGYQPMKRFLGSKHTEFLVVGHLPIEW